MPSSKTEWLGEKYSLSQLRKHLIQRYKLSETVVEAGGDPLVFTAVGSIDTLLEGVENEDDIPFWAEIWDSAIGVARFVLSQDMLGLSVLELGCGVGVSGICAASRGALVTQVDFSADALAFCRYNMLSNNVTGVTQVLADIRKMNLGRQYDRIIGSDILYEPKLHDSIIMAMKNHLAPGGVAWFADPGRKWASRFLDRAAQTHWEYSLEEVSVTGKSGLRTIDILSLRRTR